MYNCVEKQKLYRQCTDQNMKARECRAELEALFARMHLRKRPQAKIPLCSMMQGALSNISLL